MNEHNSQRLLVAWFRDRYPHLAAVFFAIPNGGARDPATGRKLKEEGALKGIPDLMLAVPRNGKAGLFLEMKTHTGTVAKDQRAAHEALREQGYAVEVARGYEAAKAVILSYLEETQALEL